jgi:hypothetical protein
MQSIARDRRRNGGDEKDLISKRLPEISDLHSPSVSLDPQPNFGLFAGVAIARIRSEAKKQTPD